MGAGVSWVLSNKIGRYNSKMASLIEPRNTSAVRLCKSKNRARQEPLTNLFSEEILKKGDRP